MGINYKSSRIDPDYKTGSDNQNIDNGNLFKPQTVENLYRKIGQDHEEEKGRKLCGDSQRTKHKQGRNDECNRHGKLSRGNRPVFLGRVEPVCLGIDYVVYNVCRRSNQVKGNKSPNNLIEKSQGIKLSGKN